LWSSRPRGRDWICGRQRVGAGVAQEEAAGDGERRDAEEGQQRAARAVGVGDQGEQFLTGRP
jgi:hypothetical protein